MGACRPCSAPLRVAARKLIEGSLRNATLQLGRDARTAVRLQIASASIRHPRLRCVHFRILGLDLAIAVVVILRRIAGQALRPAAAIARLTRPRRGGVA